MLVISHISPTHFPTSPLHIFPYLPYTYSHISPTLIPISSLHLSHNRTIINYCNFVNKLIQNLLTIQTNKKHVCPNFLSFVKSMGWPVDVRKHHGWTGHRCTMASNRCSSAHTGKYPGFITVYYGLE